MSIQWAYFIGGFGAATLLFSTGILIFYINGRDWGETDCDQSVDDPFEMEALEPMAHLDAMREAIGTRPDQWDALDLPTYLRRQSGDPQPNGEKTK